MKPVREQSYLFNFLIFSFVCLFLFVCKFILYLCVQTVCFYCSFSFYVFVSFFLLLLNIFFIRDLELERRANKIKLLKNLFFLRDPRRVEINSSLTTMDHICLSLFNANFKFMISHAILLVHTYPQAQNVPKFASHLKTESKFCNLI